MPKHKRKHKPDSKAVHMVMAGHFGTALCTGRSAQRLTGDPMLVTCKRCGREAQRIVEEMIAHEQEQADKAEFERQRAALAQNQPSRWWVADQVTADGPVLKED